MHGAVLSGTLSIRHAGKIYDPEGLNVIALDNVSFDIKAGEFCVVVGPSGCGKTTLLNSIAGFDQLTSGEIYLDSNLLASTTKAPLPGADRMVVFQQGALFPWKTVLWNVTCGPIQQGRANQSAAEHQARNLLSRVGLRGIENQYPGSLSGGMKRRVEIVRALINEPKVLLLDEPFRALDALTKSVVQEFLLELYDQIPKTIFFITHDIEEAIFLADRIVVMTTRPGRVLKTINVEIERPRDYRVLTSQRFLQLEREVREAIHDEARKAFEAGERELA
jgi:ABC-type nitrate/sulfonate/bicarbonate transport system ATPase subunit